MYLRGGMVDDCGFQPDRPSGGFVGVRWNPCRAPARPAGKRFRNHQVNRNSFRVPPCSGLARLWVQMKSCCAHSSLKQWLLRQCARVQCKVAVLGRLGQGNGGGTGVQVDCLRAYHDHRIGMFPQGL